MEFWSLFTPYSCLPAGSIYLLVITSPERKARVGKLLLPSFCTPSHYPSCSWRLRKLSLQWLVSMCGFQYSTAPKYLYLPYSPLKGWSSRPILLLERYVKYTSGSSRICTLSRVERFWVEEWQDKKLYLKRIKRRIAEEEEMKDKEISHRPAGIPCSQLPLWTLTLQTCQPFSAFYLKIIIRWNWFYFNFSTNESHQFIWKIFWKTVL